MNKETIINALIEKGKFWNVKKINPYYIGEIVYCRVGDIIYSSDILTPKSSNWQCWNIKDNNIRAQKMAECIADNLLFNLKKIENLGITIK